MRSRWKTDLDKFNSTSSVQNWLINRACLLKCDYIANELVKKCDLLFPISKRDSHQADNEIEQLMTEVKYFIEKHEDAIHEAETILVKYIEDNVNDFTVSYIEYFNINPDDSIHMNDLPKILEDMQSLQSLVLLLPDKVGGTLRPSINILIELTRCAKKELDEVNARRELAVKAQLDMAWDSSEVDASAFDLERTMEIVERLMSGSQPAGEYMRELLACCGGNRALAKEVLRFRRRFRK